MSISKNDIKLIKSLDQKKNRQQQMLFKVEGVKGVQEFLNSPYKAYKIFATDADFDAEVNLVSAPELAKISSLKTPNRVVGLFEIPKNKAVQEEGLTVVLDDVRDPGNLGTIIRLCDWFGVGQIICSEQTVDCYNAKVVQATMGSLTRVTIHYVDLASYFSNRHGNVYGTFMDGKSIYNECLPSDGYVVFGNEANGISPAIKKLVTRKISIPQFGKTDSTESLNVATAVAIVLNEFRRT